MNDHVPERLRDLRDARGSCCSDSPLPRSVHPTGNPIIHSQNSGVNFVPMTSGKGKPRLFCNLGWSRLPGERQSRAVTVGNKEHSFARMERTNLGSLDEKRVYLVAKSFQMSMDRFDPDLMLRRLLDDDAIIIPFLQETVHLRPQGLASPIAVDRCGDACSVTGRPADEPSSWRKVFCFDFFDALEDRHVRPVLVEHASAITIYLTEASDLESLRAL